MRNSPVVLWTNIKQNVSLSIVMNAKKGFKIKNSSVSMSIMAILKVVIFVNIHVTQRGACLHAVRE